VITTTVPLAVAFLVVVGVPSAQLDLIAESDTQLDACDVAKDDEVGVARTAIQQW
jgi:hypothetical protein